MEILNAKIESVSISMEDHGILTFYICLNGDSWGCCFGNYAVGRGYLGSHYWDATGAGLVAMMKIMDTVGVDKWEDLKGKYVRVESQGWGGSITKIGNIIKDKWFDIKEFFSKVNEDTSTFILDERPKKEEECPF